MTTTASHGATNPAACSFQRHRRSGRVAGLLVAAFALLVAAACGGGVATSATQRVVRSPVPAYDVGGDADGFIIEDEDVPLDLVIPGAGPRTVLVYPTDSNVYVPLTELAENVEMVTLVSEDSVWEGTLGRGGTSIKVDLRAGQVMVGGVPVEIAPADLMSREGQVYVAANRLPSLLFSRVVLSWTDLALRLQQADSLPIVQRLLREAKYAAFYQKHPDGRYSGGRGELVAEHVVRRPFRPLGGFALDYGLSVPLVSERTEPGGSVALGFEMFGGSLTLGARTSRSGQIHSTWRWNTAFNSNLLSQIKLGEVGATGVRSRPIEGFVLNNIPYVRAAARGEVTFAGQIQPNWAVEAWKGSELIAIDSSDARGRWSMRLPVQFGDNSYDFVAYGPGGDVVRFNRAYRLPSAAIPAGRFEYALSAGVCTGVERYCDQTANADFRLGLPKWWSLGAGVDGYWRDTMPMFVAPYARLGGPITTALGLEASVLPGELMSFIGRFDPSMRLRISALHAIYTPDKTENPWPSVGDVMSESKLTATYRPVWQGGRFILDGGVELVQGRNLDRLHFQASPTIRLRSVLLQPYGRLTLSGTPGATVGTQSMGGVRTTFSLPGPLRRLVGPMIVGLTAETEDWHNLSLAQATFFRSIGGRLRMGTTLDWRPGMSRPSVGLVVGFDQPWFRTNGTMLNSPGTRGRSGQTEAIENLTGGIGWDNVTGRPRFTALPNVLQGAVSGRVFLDANGNGVMDKGEEPIEGVRLISASQATASDKNGNFLLRGLVPFTPQVVVVDSMSQPDPTTVPKFASARVTPMPNSSVRLDIPFIYAATLEGIVTRADGAPIAGVSIIATNTRTGRTYQTATFTDGAFFLSGVVPGEYRMEVSPSVLKASGLVGGQALLDIKAEEGGAFVEGIQLIVMPAESDESPAISDDGEPGPSTVVAPPDSI